MKPKHSDIVRGASLIFRQSLLGYAAACDRNYQTSKFLGHLAAALERVERGELTRLIINVPPRHGKSRLATVEFPTWMLGRNPERKIVLTSYSNNLASKHSKEARARMQLPLFRSMFPDCKLNPRDAGAEEWATLSGGVYKATGIGGSLTGHGADLLIVDDPFKDYEEAHSATVRENVWQWFLSTAYTRLSPKGAIIIVMTRWHEDDIVGRLTDPDRQEELVQLGGEREEWTMLNFSAIARANDPAGRAAGEPLFPERFPLSRLKSIRATIGSYLWSALYDGEPRSRGGNHVTADQFRIVRREDVPPGLRWMRFWDLAASDKASADFTAGVKGAMFAAGTDISTRCPIRHLYLDGMVNRQMAWAKSKATIKAIAEAERILVGIEAIGGFKIAYNELRKAIATDVQVIECGVDGDKLTRALPWIAKAEAGEVCLVEGDWIVDFLAQSESFPAGKHDDMVDAVSGVYVLLNTGRQIFVA